MLSSLPINRCLIIFFALYGLPAYAYTSNSPRTSWFRRLTMAGTESNWFFNWAWTTSDATVSVVDHSPAINLAARPASFGPLIEDAVMGYGIPMGSFTVHCPSGEDGDGDGCRDAARYTDLAMLEYHAAEGNLGCPRLCPVEGQRSPDPSDSWIAIVQRGHCAFVDKVREAQRFGAKAVIVGGDDPNESGNSDTLLNMYSQGDASDVKIPSIFIRFTDYVRLSNLIAASNTSTSGIKTVSLQITTDYALWEWYSPILTFIVLLLLPSTLTLLTLIIHRLRAAQAARQERAPEDVVNSLPWRVWTGTGWEKHEGCTPRSARLGSKTVSDHDLENGDPDSELEHYGTQPCFPSTSHHRREADEQSIAPPWFEAQTECAICLCEFVKGDRVRILPCKHFFHLDEIDEWLIHRKKLCPVCKTDVTQPPRHYYTHSRSGDPAHSNDNASSSNVSIPHQHDQQSRVTSTSVTEQTPLLNTRISHDLAQMSDSAPGSSREY